jgi:gluconokinase
VNRPADTPVSDTGVPVAVVVMGVSGTGKSTLGALLAKTLGCPFLEGDDFHAPAAVEKMRAGHPLEDADRWPWLDRLGQALGEAAAANGCAVAACSALRRSYRDRLIVAAGGRVRFVLLDNSRDELLRRLSDRPGHYMPPSLLDSQLATLERPATDEPVLTLNSSAEPAALCEAAIGWLR